MRPAEQEPDSASVEIARRRMARAGQPGPSSGLPPSRSVLAPRDGGGATPGAGEAGAIPISEDSGPSSALSSSAPSPRGSHSAVLIGEDLWVFGGYGGWVIPP